MPGRRQIMMGVAQFMQQAQESESETENDKEKLESSATEDRDSMDVVEPQEQEQQQEEEQQQPKQLPFKYDYCKDVETVASAVFDETNFAKSVRFSPDGTCLLTVHENNVMNVIESNDTTLSPALSYSVGECVYDCDWYPFMNSETPASCCFIATSRANPIHLYDAYSHKLRATYQAFNHLDEIYPAISCSFNLQGDKVFAGFDRQFCYFTVDCPGRPTETVQTSKTRKSREGQRGLLSCFAFNPDLSGLVAVGSYQGSVCLYSESDLRRCVCEVESERSSNGVTQVAFGADGSYLYGGTRKGSGIEQWDIRKSTSPVACFARIADTNQRIGFALSSCGRRLVTGSSAREALVYDTRSADCLGRIRDDGLLADSVNCVSVHEDRVALSTGQRHFWCCDSDDSDTEDCAAACNTVSILKASVSPSALEEHEQS